MMGFVNHGLPVTEEQLQVALDLADQNSDGIVSFQEFDEFVGSLTGTMSFEEFCKMIDSATKRPRTPEQKPKEENTKRKGKKTKKKAEKK
jgi:Ca2+-binding EF-hand superfamily protein